ncbi:hypothetical protein E5P85_03170 [Helicobacter pylori]|nr:hypothetical protein E5P85_03170 [Helicobacter pylori]
MTQKVHSVSYLARAEFEIKDGVYDLVALPSGAEVVKVSVEVLGSLIVDGHIHVGFKDEPTKNYFLTLEKTVADRAGMFATSERDYTATSNKVVVAEVGGVSKMDGVKCVLRVLYFLPSVIEVEY